MSPAKGKFAAHEKAAILKKHLIGGVPVSNVSKKIWNLAVHGLLMAE